MSKLNLLFLLLVSINVHLLSNDKSDNDNHSNQMNPNNDAYWESRGYDERPDDWESSYEDHNYSQQELDNRSNQMNPNNDAYWQSRKYRYRNDNYNGFNKKDFVNNKSTIKVYKNKYNGKYVLDYCSIEETIKNSYGRKQGYSIDNNLEAYYANLCLKQKQKLKEKKKTTILYRTKNYWDKNKSAIKFVIGGIFLFYILKKFFKN